MLKLILLATIFALSYSQTMNDLLGQLPTADKCSPFSTNGDGNGINRDGCWSAGCGVCVNAGSITCIPRVVLTLLPTPSVKTNPCDPGTWEVPKVGDLIPSKIIDEIQANRDVWFTPAERQAIVDAVTQKVTDLKAKCGAADQKQACLDSLNSWLGEYATLTDQEVLDKVKQFKDAFELKLRSLNDFNITSNTECEDIIIGADEKKKEAKFRCIYNRQVKAMQFFRKRIESLQNVLEFQKLQVVVLVRLSRTQISLAIDSGDLLKPLREAIVERLRDFVVLTLVVDKLKEKLITALANRDKAIALLENINARANEIKENKIREVKDAIAEIKQKVEDFKAGVRDFIKTYAKNAVECKVNVDTSDSRSVFTVTCSINKEAGETLDQIRNRFKDEVKSVIEAQVGVDVAVDNPTSTTDSDVVPQIADPAAPAKRSVSQTTLETLMTQAAFGSNSASSVVISFAILAITFLAMLF